MPYAFMLAYLTNNNNHLFPAKLLDIKKKIEFA